MGTGPALLEVGRRLRMTNPSRPGGCALGGPASGGAGNRVATFSGVGLASGGCGVAAGFHVRSSSRWRRAAAPPFIIAPATAQGARDPWPSTEPGHRSTLILGPGTRFPVARRITIGLDKSMLVELPVDMKDVIVSKPEVLDVTVLNPRQANLLAKGAGDANAFILGPDGQKLVLLEVTVARDLTPLADALARLLPGSRIRVEALGDNVVLTGSVIDPIDASRAADIAGRYARNKDAVVNMLAVGTKEQVLLKVQVGRDAARRHPAHRRQRADRRPQHQHHLHQGDPGRRGGLGPRPPRRSDAWSRSWRARASFARWPSPTSPLFPASRPSSWPAANSPCRWPPTTGKSP